MTNLKILFVVTLSYISFSLKSQINPNYNFQNLSSVYYKSQSDSLKKSIKAAPLYTKATQKKYEEIWDQRITNICNSINNNNYVYSTEVNNYLSSILNDIIKYNKEFIPSNILLLLDRSADINAYTSGLNIISVNAGLLEFVKSREELAFILAHELAHNHLKHTDNAIEKSAEWLTSEEYFASLKDIKNAKYEKFSMLKKMAQTYSFDRKKHSRINESNADSLAVVFLKNANLPFDAKWLLRLDSADTYYRKSLNDDLPIYFQQQGIQINTSLLVKKSKGLSTRILNTQSSDDDVIQDSLKTHPDCYKRYELTNKWTTSNYQPHPLPNSIIKETKKIIILNLFINLNLTACLYRLFLDKDNGFYDSWYEFMFHNIVFGLWYSINDLNRFNAIRIKQKEYISKSYYQTQTLLEQISLEEIDKIFNDLGKAAFWEKLPEDAKDAKEFIQTIYIAKKQKEISNSSKEYLAKYPYSIYREFVDLFK